MNQLNQMNQMNQMSLFKPFFKFVILFSAILSLDSCSNSQGTSTGNPLVNLRSGVFTSLSIQAVSEARFCFKRIRFKQAGELTNIDPTIDEDNIDFQIGLKILSTAGDNFGSIRVPPGNYTRIEFDLDNSCAVGYAVSVTNAAPGPLSTSQSVTIKFFGNITINSDVSIELALQNLVNALNTVTDGAQIKTQLEAASGVY